VRKTVCATIATDSVIAELAEILGCVAEVRFFEVLIAGYAVSVKLP
jgi:hypothetical protein